MKNWLDKMERRFGRYAIRNLTMYLVVRRELQYLTLYDRTNENTNRSCVWHCRKKCLEVNKRCKLCEKRVKRWNGIDKVKSRR